MISEIDNSGARLFSPSWDKLPDYEGVIVNIEVSPNGTLYLLVKEEPLSTGYTVKAFNKTGRHLFTLDSSKVLNARDIAINPNP